MTTLAASRRSTKAARPFSCEFISIVARICDHRYSVDRIPPGEDGSIAYRLTKHAKDDGVYDVLRQHDGIIACSCPDYESRHRGNGHGLCKHGRALVELGLMPGPSAPVVVESHADSSPVPVADFRGVTKIVEPAACCEPAEIEPCATCVCGACVESAECDQAEDEDAGDPLGWPAWTDEHFWALIEPEPEPAPAIAPDVALVMNAFIGKGLEMARDASVPAAGPIAEDGPADGQDEPEGPMPEDLEDFHRWSLEADARQHLDQSARLTLAELVERQRDFYRGWATDAGDLIADNLAELAGLIRFTKASTPSEHYARIDALDRDDEDRAPSPRFAPEPAGYPFGHPA